MAQLQTTYCSASLLALHDLGRLKGYTLVATDKHGINAFFVRTDILECQKVQVSVGMASAARPQHTQAPDPLHHDGCSPFLMRNCTTRTSLYFIPLWRLMRTASGSGLMKKEM